MDHSVAYTKDLLAKAQLPLFLVGWIDTLLQGLIEFHRAKATSGHGREDLDFAGFSKIFRNPLRIES